jgi:DNA modification methylase
VPTKESSRKRVDRHSSNDVAISQTQSGLNTGRKAIVRNLSASGSGVENIEVWAESIRRKRSTHSGFSTSAKVDIVGYDVSLPSNVLHYAPESTNKGHSAVFPETLPEFFIKAFTDEGDLVYDPFSGSGTTCTVADKLNRKWVGSEVIKKSVYQSLKRIEIARGGVNY